MGIALIERGTGWAVMTGGPAFFLSACWLIRRERWRHRYFWIMDGRPNDYSLLMSEANRNPIAISRVVFRWLCRTPEWMKQDSLARLVLSCMRCGLALFVMGMATALLLAAME